MDLDSLGLDSLDLDSLDFDSSEFERCKESEGEEEDSRSRRRHSRRRRYNLGMQSKDSSCICRKLGDSERMPNLQAGNGPARPNCNIPRANQRNLLPEEIWNCNQLEPRRQAPC